MESGTVIEFIDDQKIISAVVLDVKNLRLHLLTENNREVKLAVGRIAHHGALRLDPSSNRDKLVAGLKEISARRRKISAQIDLQGLWEVLNSEQEWIDLATMTALCFPRDADGDHQSAVIRAIFGDRLYFKFSPDRFFPHSREKVEQIMAQRKTAEHIARIVEQGGQWMRKVLKGQATARPEESDDIIEILISYHLFENDSPHRHTAREILAKAGAGAPTAIFTFMVKIGRWHPHENIELLRHNIPTQIPAAILSEAQALCTQASPAMAGRRDLRDQPIMTIDGPATLDFDDAVSITADKDVFQLGIHIADVAQLIGRSSALDQEANARASSIYMPDQKIPMLPPCLSEDACSLIGGNDRPAISTLITINAAAEILHYEIVPSVVRVTRQLSYQDVDVMIGQDRAITALHVIATRYRRRRLDNGALMIELPEITLWLGTDGEPGIARIDRESPARMLVAELMILNNDMAARCLAENQTPAIFRSQAEPRERLFKGNEGSLFQNWMQRRLINRFILNSAPEPHSGLGLPAYVTASSPIRKYTDLITQRQLRSVLGLETAYTRAEIDFIIATLQETIGRVGRIQAQRQRYWLLRYLENQTGSKVEGIVLYKRREGHAVLLPDYMIECHLSGADIIKLKPEDLVQVTIQHVNARNDVITVYLG